LGKGEKVPFWAKHLRTQKHKKKGERGEILKKTRGCPKGGHNGGGKRKKRDFRVSPAGLSEGGGGGGTWSNEGVGEAEQAKDRRWFRKNALYRVLLGAGRVGERASPSVIKTFRKFPKERGTTKQTHGTWTSAAGVTAGQG